MTRFSSPDADDILTLEIGTAGTGAAEMTAEARFT
jgi:hypothetical protein